MSGVEHLHHNAFAISGHEIGEGVIDLAGADHRRRAKVAVHLVHRSASHRDEPLVDLQAGGGRHGEFPVVER